MVINAEKTATRLRCRADEAEQAGHQIQAAVFRKVANALHTVAVEVTSDEEWALITHGSTPWGRSCEC